LSIGNIHNNVRRAHRDGLVLLGFLAVPKSKCVTAGTDETLRLVVARVRVELKA
jgi:hypothetical protein